MAPSTIDILQSFYIQINLQPIQFTTAGFYIINLPFLAGIFTGIASYQSNFFKFKWLKFNNNFNFLCSNSRAVLYSLKKVQ